MLRKMPQEIGRARLPPCRTGRERVAPLGAEVLMAKPPRDFTSFGSNTYFITASTWGKRSLFQADRMARLFIDTLQQYRSQHKYLLHEFVVMPDHIHLSISPIDIPLARAMQFIKGGYSYRAKKELGLNMKIWERGYVEHRVRDVGDFEHHVEYIRENPVRARLAERPESYPHSSATCRVGLDPCSPGLKPRSPLVA
jgi:putative transposase